MCVKLGKRMKRSGGIDKLQQHKIKCGFTLFKRMAGKLIYERAADNIIKAMLLDINQRTLL